MIRSKYLRFLINSINVIILVSWTSSCQNKDIIYLYPNDESECITVINSDNFRYIINGSYKKVPKNNYVKLDVENVSKLGDAIYVCWHQDSYNWIVTVDKSIVIENTLDTSKYKFENTLPRDERGIPTEKPFRKDNCMVYSFYLNKVTPNQGGRFEKQ